MPFVQNQILVLSIYYDTLKYREAIAVLSAQVVQVNKPAAQCASIHLLSAVK